jgi:hypothetical protein
MARRKMGDASSYVLPIGLVVIAGFLAYKFLGGSGGAGTGLSTSPGTGTNNTNTNSTTTSINQTAYTQSAATVAQATPDTTLNAMIQTMWNDWLSSTSIFAGSSYGDDIVSQMGNLQNITDLYRLIMLFGTRAMPPSGFNLCNAIGLDCPQVDFGTFIHQALSTSQIADLNSSLSGNGINYTFS